MRFDYLVSLVVLVGCGPAVATSSGTDGDEGTASGSRGQTEGTGGPQTGSTSLASAGEATSSGAEGASEEGSSGTTGEPAEPRWCWSSTWTDAKPVSGLWMGEGGALAAAASSVLTFDGQVWTPHPLEAPLPEVWMVAAQAFDDAWFGHPFEDRLVRFDGVHFEPVDLPLSEARLLSLVLDPDGWPWVLMRPDPGCGGIGPCEEEPAQLYQFDGTAWTEHEGTHWADGIVAASDTMWGFEQQGQIAHAGFGGEWTFIDVDFEPYISRFEPSSPTAFWVGGSTGYGHYADGTWSTGPVSSVRAMTATPDGASWWVIKSPVDEQGTLGRRDGVGWESLAAVPDTQVIHVLDGQSALLGTPGQGSYISRVDGLDGAPEVVSDYARDDVGDFFDMFVPRSGEVVGLRAGLDMQRLREGVWSEVGGRFTSVWGTSLEALWAVTGDTGRLWRVEGAEAGPVDFPVESPRLAEVWGPADDDVYVCGAPSVGSAGVSNELLVMHWDGTQWADISPPDVQNIGGPNYLDLHGADGHLYVKTALRVYDYDGTGWDSSFSPDTKTELRAIRAFSPQAVFVLDENDTLLVHDGETWAGAAGVWPELAGLSGRARLLGSPQAGIYLSLIDPEGEAPDQLWVYQGEGFEPVELPEALLQGATVGVAEDGSELWLDDGRRIWTAVRCE